MANIDITSMPKTYKSWANGYRALIDTSFKKGQDYRVGVFAMETTENWEDRVVEIGGIDDFSVWNDGARASQTDIKEGYAKTFVQVPFGKELPIGRLLGKFQGKDVNLTKRAAIALGRRAYRHQQKSAYSLLGYGFSDTNTYLTGVTGSTVSGLGPDGKRLFSTLHPCSPTNSTTWSNALADNAVVGEDSLKAHIENLNNQKDDKGEKMHFGEQGYIWLVTLEDYPEAKRVVGSDLRAGTNDNDANVYKGAFDGRPIEVRWVPWLSDFSTTAHFLLAKEAVDEYMPLCVYTTTEFYTDDYVDDPTKTAYVRGQMVYTVGFTSGRGISGCQGTGSGTYSA